MIDTLVQVFYFFRPLMFYYIDASILGMNLFELLTAVMIGILVIALFAAPSRMAKPADSLDGWMIGFAIWCLLITVVQWEVSDWKLAIRWLLPFVAYVMLRRLIVTDRQYMKCLRVLVCGFGIMASINAVAIAGGSGYLGAHWLTGIERYRGVFHGVHTMSHAMAFGLMVLMVYHVIQSARVGRKWWRREPLMLLAAVAMVPTSIYSIIKGNVRTVIVGLFVFLAVIAFRRSKKVFVAYLAATIVMAAALPVISKVFWDVPMVGATGNVEMAGSGRPFVWKHNLSIYVDLPLEQKLMGVGVGNVIGQLSSSTLATSRDRNAVWDSHNDFLAALMETGLVGFVIVITIHCLLWRMIRRNREPTRSVFFALFWAVVVMDFFSNSYLSRVGLGQLFLMTLVGADVLSRLDPRATACNLQAFRPLVAGRIAGRRR